MAGYATLPQLLDARRLRAAGFTLRTDPATTAPSRDPDLDLVAAVSDPFEPVDGVLDRLRALGRPTTAVPSSSRSTPE